MRTALPLLLVTASLLCVPVAMALNEYGIEGMGVVATRAGEGRATITPDGQRIVFASDRSGGAGGWDLWQADLRDGRWQDARPLPFNTDGDELDPWFSHDGQWLLFASRRGGRLALFRAAVHRDGTLGVPEPLAGADAGRGPGGGERGPALSPDGRWLLFSRDAGAGRGWDLHVAPMQDGQRGAAVALEALNTPADETDGDWIGNQGGILFSRTGEAGGQVWQSACAWRDGDMQPLALSFNRAEGMTGQPVVDASKPTELLLVSDAARAPRAGSTDVYRMALPRQDTVAGCVPHAARAVDSAR